MPTIIPTGFSAVTHVIATQAPGGYHQSTLNYGVAASPDLTVCNTLASNFETVWGEIGSTSAVVLKTIMRDALTTFETVQEFPGTVTDVQMPPQVAVLAKKVTGMSGRANRGRLYIPACLPRDDLGEDGKGLKTDGEFADTERGIELYKLGKMKPRPAISGLSIGYIAKESIPRSQPDEPRRQLKRIDLIEISPVTFPMNGKARISSVKSADFTERNVERWLMQDAGLSRSEARVVINQGFKSLIAMRDAGSSELADLAECIKRCTVI